MSLSEPNPKPEVSAPAANVAPAAGTPPSATSAPAVAAPAAAPVKPAAPAPAAAKPAAPAAPPPPPPPPTGDFAEELTRKLGALAPKTVSGPKFVCQILDFNVRGVHLDAAVKPEEVVAAAQLLDQFGFAIDTVTGVDWLAEGQMEVVYDYFHPLSSVRVAVRTRVPRATPEVPTISTVFPGADWHERETHDFFGIRFAGHPNLTPLLLPEDADYHPLRKDFTA